MRQFLLAAALIALPVGMFTGGEAWLVPSPPAASASVPSDPLGDLSGYEAIVADTSKLVEAGDLTAAEKRITDFETKWDQAESTLRPKAPAAWGNVDAAADRAFAALRARNPAPEKARQALAALSATLTDPSGGGPSGGVRRVSGIAVTDANGHAIPCESMLTTLRMALTDGSIPAAGRATAADLQAKAIERCNADDDARADAFAGQALALAGH